MDIAITPLEGIGFSIIAIDVAHDFAFEIIDGSEDTTGDHVSFNFGKPNFHLVEPSGVSGSVMDMQATVSSHKLAHTGGFVSRKIVRNDVDVATSRLSGNNISKKCHKLFAGIARGGFSPSPVAVLKAAYRDRVPWR